MTSDIAAPILTAHAPDATVAALVRRARLLYSLPVVAAEVLSLTNQPGVDAYALKVCIERDPALTAKILRVVNSSLFGLSREVSDLNQAVALLGIKPLKLLVLGFSLPESLFSNMARDQLAWYWSTTLSRAVAAREISEQWFEVPGDEAFLAGLLQDVGVLVLMGQLQQPYAAFLGRAIDAKVDLAQAERDSLGFDHKTLTAALLEHWNMPPQLISAIGETPEDLAPQYRTPRESMKQVLHLATLLAELVGQHRLGVLPELMEAGDRYCRLDKPRLRTLLESLQPKVEQLAGVLSLDLLNQDDYLRILTTAHEQMAILVEPHPNAADEQMLWNRPELPEVAGVREALLAVLAVPDERAVAQENLSVASDCAEQAPTATELCHRASFMRQLTLVAGQCRSARLPLSLIAVETREAPFTSGAQGERLLAQLLDTACQSESRAESFSEETSPLGRVLVLPGYDRQEAVRVAHAVLRHVEKSLERLCATGRRVHAVTSAGVAAVGLPPRNFAPDELVRTGERCLAAARSSDANVVKSLEIY